MDVVVGLGETGRPLFNVLKATYPDTLGYDLKEVIGEWDGEPVRYINICLPYFDNFVDVVNEYRAKFRPVITIIHSTVPIGTTAQIPDAVHSPILGKHDNMEHSIRNFNKWIGGNNSHIVSNYFKAAGMDTMCVCNSETTEALKLFCLAKYGMAITFAQYQKDVCDKYGINYDDILLWDEDYNDHVAPDLRRPLITPPDGKIGGHCVVQNTRHLNKQHPNPILDEILKYDPDKVHYKAWGISNIYPSAKIGKDVNIGTFCEIGANVKIGDRVRIGAMSFIPEGVTIKDDAWIGPRVCFSNDTYPPSGKDNWKETLVCNNARIGANAMILPGITIGEGALIGMGSVVTKNIPSYEVWAGNPARYIRSLEVNEVKIAQ